MKLIHITAVLAILVLSLPLTGVIAQTGPSIDIETLIQGEDADNPPGPKISVNTPVEWTYVVTNTGNQTIINLEVTDDQKGVVSCPVEYLHPGESVTCSVTGIAAEGQHKNIGKVTGLAIFDIVSDEDPVYYFGVVDNPTGEEVIIDVKPGVDPNIINPRSIGVIPVAIITTDDFNAADIDGSTVEFGPNGAKPVHEDGHLEDVGGDDRLDWLGHFRTQEIFTTQEILIQAEDAEATLEVTLTGMTSGEEEFTATDQIVIVHKPGKSKAPEKTPALPPLRCISTTWGMLKSKH